ncbi:MAG: heparinase II/III family protein [Clostridia bacterium]|nr:heparinase II/III family protein [Clostridia bacterium]
MLDFAKSKELWRKIRESEEFAQHRKELLSLYNEAFRKEPRAHSVEEILSANDNGLWREQFDHLQSSALLSLIYPDNEEYYNSLLKTVWAYLNEYTWAPLGHYTEQYYGRTPKDFDFGLIDIFAASVAFSLAEVKNLFMDRFPQLLIDRITYEIRRRTIEPYLTRKFFWESHDNNWTAVCTGSVGAVLLYEAPELYLENRERLHKSFECYLASYNDDGMCVEGVGYWMFGFGFFASFALLEREYTKGEVDWFKNPKVKEISKFAQKTFLQRDVMVTFSDSSIKSNYFFGIPHMLRSVYGDEIEKLPRELGEVVHNNTHFCFALRSLIYYKDEYLADKMAENVVYHTQGSTYFTKRTKNYGFAVKGGNNGESHNHIDVGSFILARDNKQIIADIGAGPYEDGYHTSRRYTYFNPSAYSHSIPIFDGIGEDDIRRDNVVIEYDGESEIYMDITNAYGVDFLIKAERAFSLTDNEITLKDTFTFTKETEIKERLVSIIEPKIKDGVVTIEDVTITTPGGIVPQITTKQAKRHLDSSPYTVYLVDYTTKAQSTTFTITFKM